jgi:hypothetical protein
MNNKFKWAARLAHVREISLFGAADLRFWTDWLQKEDLRPAEANGQAQLMIVAAHAKYMGLDFQEISFSVAVQAPGEHASHNAAYLAGAFNSRRFLAFCERVFFSTPYEHGRVTLSTALPTAIALANDRRIIFRAAMSDTNPISSRKPMRASDDGWEGPLFLPNKGRSGMGAGKVFVARLWGHTKVYPFVATDSLIIEPTAECVILRAFRDSKFVAQEWVIREDAEHAKSKTYSRNASPWVTPLNQMVFEPR